MYRNNIEQAIAAYQGGQLRQALWLLGGPPAEGTLAEADAQKDAHAAAGGPTSGAVADWIGLAQSRIRHELGDENFAIVPVVTCLRTTLGLLGDEAKTDAGLPEAMTDGED